MTDEKFKRVAKDVARIRDAIEDAVFALPFWVIYMVLLVVVVAVIAGVAWLLGTPWETAVACFLAGVLISAGLGAGKK